MLLRPRRLHAGDEAERNSSRYCPLAVSDSEPTVSPGANGACPPPKASFSAAAVASVRVTGVPAIVIVRAAGLELTLPPGCNARSPACGCLPGCGGEGADPGLAGGAAAPRAG